MTAATHAGSFALQPSSQNPSWENWQSSEHNTGAGYMGASAGLKGGAGRTGGAGIEGGEGGLSFTSSHRLTWRLLNKKFSTSSIVAPTYTLGMPFTDSPVITSKVCCTAPAKPSARICRPAAHRLNNAKGGGLPRLRGAQTCTAMPESSIRLLSPRKANAASMAILSPPCIGLCCPSESSITNFRTPGRPPWRSMLAAACSAADIDVEPAADGWELSLQWHG